ncbi:MAG TPA: GH1 family beta-glucosidase [Thermodesulfobacteriota bacterium]|nr:beta-glucosidase [Deltaproteobacteria bacterium]HNR11986.1 GH1 family beta-glucosidase [Thermodesulfobacteriota bacterium]
MAFPTDFIWGAATSAYQIEGAAAEDGRGPSIWDHFCRKQGAVWQEQSGDTACDHYHRYANDVALMKRIGLQAYRFSVSWSRVLPQGFGTANAKGLDFYDRLVDRLLAAGITPFLTLYHWDFPQALQERGGWLQPESSDWFAAYTDLVVNRLSDRVQYWFTFNEPQIFVELGFHDGRHAPGERLPFSEVLAISHNVLRAHGKAVQAIRQISRSKPWVGYAAAVSEVPVPATLKADDIEAARQAFFSIETENLISNSWWTDPMIFGQYPSEGLQRFERSLPALESDSMRIINQPLDFIGINVYSGKKYRQAKDGKPKAVPFEAGHPLTSFQWPVVPESLYWAARFYAERYHKPLYVSENGMSNVDWVSLDGRVHDPQRIDFLRRYLQELRRACDTGIDIRGYFHWSLMDNFEWAAGYRERFGIVHIDYPTQKRTLKDSAFWYKKVISARGLHL